MRGRVVLFGKLPAVGDFVSRGMTAEAAAFWDAWATAELCTARDVLDVAFEATHDVAPSLTFHAVDQALTGVIAPSVDKVGRRFMAMLGILDGETADRARDALLADETLSAGITSDATPDMVTAELQARRTNPEDSIAASTPAIYSSLPVGLFSDHLIAVYAQVKQ
jgi:type VI secretion system protein ImpM